jgi:hypothetical protein
LSAVAGTFTTIVAEAVKLKGARIVWADSLDDWLQFSLILFLWSTLYFSIKQWQQSAREPDRLVRAESEARAARLNALRYQLNPHFVFNSLNAASTLVLQGRAASATGMFDLCTQPPPVFLGKAVRLIGTSLRALTTAGSQLFG